MGCGTWGGNIVSENICLKHYMNTTWVARPLPEDMPSNEELFGEFNKPDMDVRASSDPFRAGPAGPARFSREAARGR